MLLIIGVHTVHKTKGAVDMGGCPNCGRKYDFILEKTVNHATLFGVPLFPVHFGRKVYCPYCNRYKALKIGKYKEIKARKKRVRIRRI